MSTTASTADASSSRSPDKQNGGEVYMRSDGKKVRRVKRSKKKQDGKPDEPQEELETLADVVEEAVQQQQNDKEHKQKTETTPLMQSQDSSPSDRTLDASLRTFDHSSSNILSVNSLFHVTEKKRLLALAHEGVGGAAFLIRDAVLGSVENPADGAYDPYANPDAETLNKVSIICRRICSIRSVSILNYAVIGLLLLLTFIEPPNWCRYMVREGEEIHDAFLIRKGRCEDFMSATGRPASFGADTTDADEVEYYPNTSTMLLTTHQSHLVECFCLFFLWTYIWLRIGRDGLSLRRYFRAGTARTVRIIGFTCMTFLTIGLIHDMCTMMDKDRYLAPYFRILIFISASRECMREFRTLFRMVSTFIRSRCTSFALSKWSYVTVSLTASPSYSLNRCQKSSTSSCSSSCLLHSTLGLE